MEEAEQGQPPILKLWQSPAQMQHLLGSVTKSECCYIHLMSGLHGTCEFQNLRKPMKKKSLCLSRMRLNPTHKPLLSQTPQGMHAGRGSRLGANLIC